MAFYASIFEFGQSKAFLRPAFYKTVPRLASIVQKKINFGVGPGHGHG
jgi:hypothetical protein